MKLITNEGSVIMMECKCGKLMQYNHHYQCYECDHCNRVYNAMGQELAPIDEWANDWDNEDYYD